jgi:hypothetical protein
MHLPRPDPPNISFTPFQKEMTLTSLFFDLFRYRLRSDEN